MLWKKDEETKSTQVEFLQDSELKTPFKDRFEQVPTMDTANNSSLSQL
jgi:hypothetical protein